MSAEKLELQDDGPCMICNGELDTGWECTVCGTDNRDWYYPNRPPAKTILGECKAGNLVDINGRCDFCGAKPGDKCGGLN